MTPPAPLRIGVIGTGFARRVQIPNAKLVPEVAVTAIASRERANAEAVAREFKIPHVFDDGEQLAASPDVDLVIVSSTPASHAAYAAVALEAGKHVLCEKPMALNQGEAKRMVDQAARHSRQLAWVDHELRYEPNRREVRDRIRAGAIGEVRHLELSLKPYLRGDGRPQAYGAPWNWWYDASQGGGLLGAVGSHLIDLCRFWTGSEVVQVAGRVDTFIRERTDAAGTVRPVTADDFTSFVLKLGSGATATLTLSSVAHHGPGHLAQISGTEGTMLLTGETKLEIAKAGGGFEDISAVDDLWERTTPNNMWARSFVRLLRDMAAVIAGRSRADDAARFTDGAQVQRVLDAVRSGGGRAG